MSEFVQLSVEFDATSDPVQGTVTARGGDARPFSGYVQLIAALEGHRGPSGYRGERDAEQGITVSDRTADGDRAVGGRDPVTPSGPGAG